MKKRCNPILIKYSFDLARVGPYIPTAFAHQAYIVRDPLRWLVVLRVS